MIKTSVTLPDELYKEARSMSNNFSALVAEAIRAYLRMQKVSAAADSFGKWENRDKDSTSIVDELRLESRRYVNGLD